MKNTQTLKLTLVTSFLATSMSAANAALPADAQAAVDSISTFSDDIIAAAWPIAATIVVASIGIKLFKKFSNKAT